MLDLEARLRLCEEVMTDLTQFIPNVTRVVCPGGIRGTVEKISARPNARYPILVRRDDGLSKSYAPSELTRLAVTAQQQSQARGPLP